MERSRSNSALGMAETVVPATQCKDVPQDIGMVPIVVLGSIILASILACHAIAKRRGSDPVFWGVMGAVFGPLAIPFAFLSKRRRQAKGDPGA